MYKIPEKIEMRDGNLMVMPMVEKVPFEDFRATLIYDLKVSVLYPRRGRCRCGSDAGNADAAQNRMLHSVNIDVPSVRT